MITETGIIPPKITPPTPPPAVVAAPISDNIPSAAQFAVNQQLAAKQPAPKDSAEKRDVKTSDVSLKSVAIFKDPGSGLFVTIFRDQDTGVVREQIPDEKALEFYSRLASELQHAGKQHDAVNVEA
ncbi:MAG: hypothetical protein INF44_01790 [Thalassospira sp.]|nr:hypothetical protein [Thalassospira sp.]